MKSTRCAAQATRLRGWLLIMAEATVRSPARWRVSRASAHPGAATAIGGEEGHEGRLRRRNAAIAGGTGKQPLLDLDHGHVEAGSPKKARRVSAAGVDDDDFERDFLFKQRADGFDDLLRRAIADDDDGKFRSSPGQARCNSAWKPASRCCAAILNR